MATRSRTAPTGSSAPDFELPAPGGRMVSLAAALLAGPVVLVFLRGFL